MKLVVEAVLPLFALILAGYVCGRRGVLGARAIDSLNLFVVWLALPALLFQALAEARWSELNQPAFVPANGRGRASGASQSATGPHAADRLRQGDRPAQRLLDQHG